MDTVTVTISLPASYSTPDEYQRILSLAVGNAASAGNQMAAIALAGLLSALANSGGGMVHGVRL